MKYLRVTANVALFLVFFATPIREIPWQIWFLAYALSDTADKLSIVACAKKSGWRWKGLKNTMMHDFAQWWGYRRALPLHTLVTLTEAYVVGYLVALVLPWLVSAAFLWLTIAMTEVAVSNFFWIYNQGKNNYPFIFAPARP